MVIGLCHLGFIFGTFIAILGKQLNMSGTINSEREAPKEFLSG